ncbi:MAG: hypothetical protein A3F74_26810 [Betaproteobacteria bacterium RIFCSPLOWO2_12_FULL_62_58]|nr:MAG: hypothetical protein A3F74_26810 [Betaproteobacteria bacterium RIFCSPLOWO2_12_FULL_62_58]
MFKHLKVLLAGVVLAAASGTAAAHGGVSFGLALGVPIAPAPVYVAPRAAYYDPYYYPAPAYYAPRPYYYAPRAYYYAPRRAYYAPAYYAPRVVIRAHRRW